MTERLYYENSHTVSFDAAITSCTEEKGRWVVTLEKSAFFPEGGGQKGDRGTLGGVPVLDTRERGGEIEHICAAPLAPGTTVHGVIDWALRFSRMQSHSGEHIVSGLAHSLWGCENVGFHMAEDTVTLDFDRELTAEQVSELERRANEAVWADLPVRSFFPDAETLASLPFRQKKELTGAVRIVEIEGIDRCACCAPHVFRAGEIGLIRLVDAMRHRGGVRLTMLAGKNAYAFTTAQGRDCDALSRLFSAPRTALVPAAERVLAEQEQLKSALAQAEREAMLRLAAETLETEGNLLRFESPSRSGAALRLLSDALADKCGGFAAVFAGKDGEGYRYALTSRHADLRMLVREMNSALSGRGGGSRELVQGTVSCSRAAIEAWMEGLHGQG